MPISACILIHQWHPKLLDTIASYKDCCSQILLGVNGGFDPKNYRELIPSEQLKLIPLEWKGYGATKNELAAHADNDWILSVDTDEVANEELQQSLNKIRLENPNTIYALGMCHYLGEKPILHGSWKIGKRSFLRLYNKQYTQWDEAAVHESIIIPDDAAIVRLKGRINHYTATDYRQFLEKNKHYAKLSALKYRKNNKTTFIGKSWLSAIFSFLKNYLFCLGFLDGKAGWQIAKGTALYTFWKYQGLRKERD